MNQKNNNGIQSLKGKIIKQVHVVYYLGSYVVSTDHNISVRVGHAWVALKNMTSIWKSNLSVKLNNIYLGPQSNRYLYMAPSHRY